MACLAAGSLLAQEVPAPAPAPSPQKSEAPPAAEKESEVDRRLRLLEESNRRLAEEVARLRRDQEESSTRLSSLASNLSGRISGYLDMGFFATTGDGSGIRSVASFNDPSLKARFPGFGDVPDGTLFLGDPLSTAVNSRGEPAETHGPPGFDWNPIHNSGAPSFIVNNLNVALFGAIGQSLTVNGLIDFLPRGREVSGGGGELVLGDFLDVKLAYAEWTVPTDRLDLKVSFGKIDSVLGIEYRTQESPDRITVTPSLICRYTCGRPLGLRARARLADDRLVIAIALTNGSSFVKFFPFHDVIDQNAVKTFSGRISTKIPVGAGLELGASGAVGAQDGQPGNTVLQWHAGGDLHLEVRDLDLRGEYVRGAAGGVDAPGAEDDTCGLVACLYYQGAYGQIAYRAFNWLMPYVRVDWRDAFIRFGNQYAYVSDLMRVTGGLRMEIGEAVILKAEYTYNRELGQIPQFDDDVFTSSVVVKY